MTDIYAHGTAGPDWINRELARAGEAPMWIDPRFPELQPAVQPRNAVAADLTDIRRIEGNIDAVAAAGRRAAEARALMEIPTDVQWRANRARWAVAGIVSIIALAVINGLYQWAVGFGGSL